MTKRAAVYCRISSDREGRELGVQRQQEDCQAMAERLGYVVVEVYQDNDISASTRSKKARPQYKRMLADAKAGAFDLVIAYTSGRLTRKPREHEDLIELAEEHKTRFEYVRSPSFDLNTAAGRRVARIMAATDAGEAEDIQERVMRQHDQKAAAGEWFGGRRPFGYEADGVTVRLDEARHVRQACEQIVNGASLRSLVQELNAAGSTTSTGAAWSGRALSRVLQRPRNAGLMEHRGQIVGKASWPAIVPETLWRRACGILSDPARTTTTGNTVKYLGSGIYRCHCGAVVRAHTTSGGSPGRRRKLKSYVCSEHRHLGRNVSEVDALVREFVIERLSSDEAVGLLAADTGEDTTGLEEQAKQLDEELDDLAAAHGRDELTLSQLTTASAFKRKRLEKLRQQIAAAGRRSVLAGLVGVPDVAAAWDALHLDRQRAVVDRLFTVELWRSTRGRPKGWQPGESYFDPATVKITPKR